MKSVATEGFGLGNGAKEQLPKGMGADPTGFPNRQAGILRSV